MIFYNFGKKNEKIQSTTITITLTITVMQEIVRIHINKLLGLIYIFIVIGLALF